MTAKATEPADGLPDWYPRPTSADATKIMKANRRRDTGPEVALRRELHRRGLRYRKDHLVRLEGRRPVRIDVAFTRLRVAIFVDGCFWHRCPEHGVLPASNRSYWEPKLDRNTRRDREIDSALALQGWEVVHIWEHTPPLEAADAVMKVVARHRRGAPDREDQ